MLLLLGAFAKPLNKACQRTWKHRRGPDLVHTPHVDLDARLSRLTAIEEPMP